MVEKTGTKSLTGEVAALKQNLSAAEALLRILLRPAVERYARGVAQWR